MCLRNIWTAPYIQWEIYQTKYCNRWRATRRLRGNNHQFAWIEDEKTNLKYIGLPPQKKQFSFNLGLKVILLVINKFTFKKCLCDRCTDFVKMVYMYFNSGSCNPVSCANPQLCWNISIEGISPCLGYWDIPEPGTSPCWGYQTLQEIW